MILLSDFLLLRESQKSTHRVLNRLKLLFLEICTLETKPLNCRIYAINRKPRVQRAQFKQSQKLSSIKVKKNVEEQPS